MMPASAVRADDWRGASEDGVGLGVTAGLTTRASYPVFGADWHARRYRFRIAERGLPIACDETVAPPGRRSRHCPCFRAIWPSIWLASGRSPAVDGSADFATSSRSRRAFA